MPSTIKLVFPTDEHVPFQDSRAIAVAQRIASDFNPDLRIAGSDGLDFYSISKFDKNPERAIVDLQNEIDAWTAGQRNWKDASPNAAVFWLLGNHEDRWRKYLWKHPEISGLEMAKLPNLLNFAALKIPWGGSIDAHRELDLFGRLLVTHGDVIRKCSAYTAKGMLDNLRFSRSVMIGHTHRGGTHISRTRDGYVTGQECFCLCGLNPEYALYPDWQQGLVLAEVSQENLHIEPIPFFHKGGRVVARWRDKEYIA